MIYEPGEVIIANLCVWDVWLPQAEVLFDTDAQSFLG